MTLVHAAAARNTNSAAAEMNNSIPEVKL